MAYSEKALLCSLLDQVVNAGRLDRLGEMVAPDVTAHLPDRSEPVEGLAALAEVITGLRAAFPDLNTYVEGGRILHEFDGHMVGKGRTTDRVAAHVVFRGTQSGPYLGMAPSGREAVWSEAWFAQVEGGRLVEITAVADRLSMYRQLGAEPADVFATAPDTRPREAV
jgi:predicted ester cyclase